MKKFIFALFVLASFTSCAVQYDTCTVCDITWLNNNGDLVDRWNNAVVRKSLLTIDSENGPSETVKTKPSFASGLVRFDDEHGNDTAISGGMILLTHIRTSASLVENKDNLPYDTELSTLKAEYNNLKESLYEKDEDGNGIHSQQERKSIKDQMEVIARKFFNLTGYSITVE